MSENKKSDHDKSENKKDEQESLQTKPIKHDPVLTIMKFLENRKNMSDVMKGMFRDKYGRLFKTKSDWEAIVQRELTARVR